jgi:hypothetical protein
MKKHQLLFALLFALVVSPGFRCNTSYNDPCTGGYKEKQLATSLTPSNPLSAYKIGDTVKFSAIVSDTLLDATTSEKISFNLDQLSLHVETFKVVIPAGSTVPNLQPVFSDFNPVILDGQIATNNYNSGIRMLYRRLNGRNYLSGGIECGRKGTYILRFTNENNYQGTNLYNNTLFPCTNFILTTQYIASQNNSIFTTYNISTINPLPTYVGFRSISRNDKNYVVIEVN